MCKSISGPIHHSFHALVCSRGIRSNSKAVSCDGSDEWTRLQYCNQHSMEIPSEIPELIKEHDEINKLCTKSSTPDLENKRRELRNKVQTEIKAA